MFAEQSHNAKFALSLRIGTVLNKFTLTKERIVAELMEVSRKTFSVFVLKVATCGQVRNCNGRRRNASILRETSKLRQRRGTAKKNYRGFVAEIVVSSGKFRISSS